MQHRLGRSAQGFHPQKRSAFPLLLDPGKQIATAYGAANGIPILGLDRRITYVIDENGKILKVYPSVDPSTHAIEILSDLGITNAAPPAQAKPAAGASN